MGLLGWIHIRLLGWIHIRLLGWIHIRLLGWIYIRLQGWINNWLLGWINITRDRFTWVFHVEEFESNWSSWVYCCAGWSKLNVQMFDLVTFLFSIYNSENMDYILAVYWSLHRHTYDKGTTAGIYGVYTMEVHNNSALTPATEEIYQKYGVYTMDVRNNSALAPSTEYLRRRFMEYILWWYIITSP